jgi:hypothetical protein
MSGAASEYKVIDVQTMSNQRHICITRLSFLASQIGKGYFQTLNVKDNRREKALLNSYLLACGIDISSRSGTWLDGPGE